MEEPDPQVVAAARRGDVAAFEILVRRYQGDVWRLAVHLLHDESLADDVTQEAFVRAFRFLPRYRGEAKFSTWLFTIARNCANDEMRRSGRRRNLQGRLDQERPRTPSDESVALEVREALAALPMDLREPVVLIDMFGASYAEVAGILGTPVGTVKSRVHRARSTLAHSLLAQRRERAGEG
jgi:RNA polymerase sigma-70 factor (ECF subfamily)